MQLPKLKAHPRLYATPENLDRIKHDPDMPLLKSAWRKMQEIAEEGLLSAMVEYDEHGHNSLLVRARAMQQRVVTLAAMWRKTGERRYVDAVMQCIETMDGWEYWSWIAMRNGKVQPDAIYDLSYGENATTLAIAYDWLFDALSPEERSRFVNVAQRRALQPFLHNTSPEEPPRWLGRPDSNWNTVCTGGAGMLALAMAEEIPEAAEIVARTEKSIEPFIQSLEATGGGWPEGIGYWNYGMRYAFMYLLSWENAHGAQHPLLQQEAVRRTLHFPLEFTPHGQGCSFGDVADWVPLPFHYAMAERLEDDELIVQLDAFWPSIPDLASRWDQSKWPDANWPNAAEFLILHPRRKVSSAAPQKQVAKLYGNMGWGILADQLPEPRFYASVRGGSTKVPHSHRDLMSLHCVVGDEKMIENLVPREYLDTTFSGRRNEIFEITPAAKNTLLINGVGITTESSAPTTLETFGNHRGIRIDATQAMGDVGAYPAALFCARVFIQLEDKGLLIVDHVEFPHPARVEARFYSPHHIVTTDTTATVKSQRQQLHLSFAATKPAVLQAAQVLMTSPAEAPRPLLRWSTRDITPQGISFATLLVPGHTCKRPAELSLISKEEDGRSCLVAHVAIADWSEEISLNTQLLSF